MLQLLTGFVLGLTVGIALWWWENRRHAERLQEVVGNMRAWHEAQARALEPRHRRVEAELASFFTSERTTGVTH